MQDKTETIGYPFTRAGSTPQPNTKLRPCCNADTHKLEANKEFDGYDKLYRDRCEKRSRILAPLYDLASSKKNKNWRWIEVEQAAFDDAKVILAQEAILNYLDFSKPFVIYSDASEFQLGAIL